MEFCVSVASISVAEAMCLIFPLFLMTDGTKSRKCLVWVTVQSTERKSRVVVRERGVNCGVSASDLQEAVAMSLLMFDFQAVFIV